MRRGAAWSKLYATWKRCDVPAPKPVKSAVAREHRPLTVQAHRLGSLSAHLAPSSFRRDPPVLARRVERAKTSPHNQVFIDGVRATLTTDPGFQNGIFVTRPEPGLRAMGRNYAAMAMSQTFYREEVWRQAGFSSLEDFHVMSCAIQLESAN